MGTLREPPKPPADGLPRPPARPTLERAAPKLGRPKPAARDGPALERRTLLGRLDPLFGRLTEPLDEGLDGGRRTVPVAEGGRVTADERATEGARATVRA